jgi:hypothetical protein
MQVYVITESDEFARSIAGYFRHARGVTAASIVLSPPPDLSQPWILRTFRLLANWIESDAGRSAEPADLSRAVAFIDLYDEQVSGFSELNPSLRGKGHWAVVVSMLLLAFPEIQWVFNTPYEPLHNPLFARGHVLGAGNTITQILNLRDAEYTPLFDPTGLRNSIRKQLRATEKSEYVPVRPQVAASIDEEDTYAYFNAYLAYRLGYRTHVITSYEMMQSILGGPADEPDKKPAPAATALAKPAAGAATQTAAGSGAMLAAVPAAEPVAGVDAKAATGASGATNGQINVELIFEDLFLSFPDQPALTWHMSDLRKRTAHFPGLDNSSQYRVLVTVGHDRTTVSTGIKEGNEQFLREWENAYGKDDRGVGEVSKPLSGFFYLWDQSGFSEWNKRYGRAERGRDVPERT